MSKAKKYISLSDASVYSGCYSQEYLSLRARQGKLKATKFGRNWVTTKEWLNEYLEGVNNYKNSKKKDGKGRVTDKHLFPSFSSLSNYLQPVRKVRLIAVVYVLVFLLLSTGVVFGHPYLEPVLGPVSDFIKTSANKLATDIWDASNEISISIEQFTSDTSNGITKLIDGVSENVSGFGTNVFIKTNSAKKGVQDLSSRTINGIKNFGGGLKFGLAFLKEEASEDLVLPFESFISFFRNQSQPEMTFGEYVKNDIQDLKNFFRKVGRAIAYPFVKSYQFVVRPWLEKIDEEKIIQEIIKQRPEITTEEIENLRAQIEKLKEEGIVAKEIVREVSKITQIEPVKEITKEITKIDEEELKKLKSQIAGIQEWESDIKTLQVLTSKLQTHPPQTQITTAPVYIGSQGIDVGGVGTFSSLGVSGSAGITNLGVGDSTSLGSDSSDKLTVQATSEFFSPVTIQNTFTVGDTANYFTVDSTGNLTTTGTLSTGGDVTVTGDFTVTGAQTYSGAASFTASSTSPALC